jgi:hypothetical protein
MFHQACDILEDNKIYRQFKSLFDLGEKIYKLANDCADEVSKFKMDSSKRTIYLDVVSRLYSSSFKTFISVLMLSNKGHGEDASSISRTVFENYLTLKYIQCKPQIYSYRFRYYPVLEEKFKIDLAKDQNSDLPHNIREICLQNENSILESYNKVKHFYIEPNEEESKCLKRYKNGNWAGINKRQMAEHAGLISDYDFVFKHLSCYVHPHAYTLRNFCEETDSEILYGAMPSDKDILNALLIAIPYFLLMLKEDTFAYKLDVKKEIEDLLAEYKQLQGNFLKNKGFEQ